MPRLKILLQSKLFLIGSLVFIISYVFLFTKVIKYESSLNINTSSLTGIIESYKIDGDKLSILLKAKEKIPLNYYFNSLEEKTYFQKHFQIGLTINCEGSLTLPSNNTIPNTFNYKEYLYHNKMFYTFNASKISILKKDIPILYRIKAIFYNRVERFNLTKNYMYAFILGDNDYIDNDIYNNYKLNGVTHLFAVSGMHISFLVMALKSLLTKIKIKENKSNIIIILFLIFYMFLIGFTASVVRASLLFIGLFINKKLNLNLSTFRVLYLIFISLLIINPFYIYNLGFNYSFLTSFGLIIFSNKITGNYLKSLLLVSIIALLFSLPLTLLNFYEFNLLSIINNIIIVPLVSLILFPLTLLTFIFPFLETILNWGFIILEWLNLILSKMSLNIVVPKINIIFIFLYYLGIYFIYKKGFKYLYIIIFLIIISKVLPYFDFNSYVYYLDVGQGDSSLIITANKKEVILIDTGGKISYEKEEWQKRNSEFNLADNIILFLKSLGITKIDLLILSHGDLDHLGYAKDIINGINVKKIMLNNNAYNYNEKELLKYHIPLIKNNYQGKNIKINNLNNIIDEDENTSSLVMFMNIKNINLLYMGDAPKSVEKNIISKYNLKVDLLKLGHHGSNTSSDYEFLRILKPKYSIISAGRNNRYHHPHKETIDNLNNLDLQYYTTQELGTIKVVINKYLKKVLFYPP